jgi:uncharacterized protein YkwD
MHATAARHRALQATALLLSSFLLLFLLPARDAEAARRKKSSVTYAESERSFRYLMNVERTGGKRSRLRMNASLVIVAREQSEDMADSGGIFHNPDLASDLRQVSWSIAGENVGVGSTVESLHQAFMDSAPHRKNVMRKAFKRVGVGVVTADGRIWVTVVFAG